jgi:hypothetical protein
MSVTVDYPASLDRDLKREAKAQGMSIDDLLKKIADEYIKRKKRPPAKPPVARHMK